MTTTPRRLGALLLGALVCAVGVLPTTATAEEPATPQAATSLVLGTDPNASGIGERVNLIATTSNTATTGFVQFQLDGAAYGTPVAVFGGVATLPTSFAAAGDYGFTAVYSGDPGFEGSTSNFHSHHVGGHPLLLSVSDAQATEGHTGTTPIGFAVSLDRPSGTTVTVKYAAVNGSAAATGLSADLTATTGTVTFAPGEMARQITMQVKNEATPEPDETFLVNLSAPVGATLSDPQAVGTILTDEPVFLTPEPSWVAEGDAGTFPLTFTLDLPGPLPHPVTVKWATAPGDARFGGAESQAASSDYTTATGTLTFPPGSTRQTHSVNIKGDTTIEGNEGFFVRYSAPSGARLHPGGGSLAPGETYGVIEPDDFPPPSPMPRITVSGSSAVEGGGVPIQLWIDEAQSHPVSVTYTTSGGTATAGSDYVSATGVATIPAGSQSTTFTVQTLDDQTAEAQETFDVVLSDPVGVVVGETWSPTALLHDNEPEISIGDAAMSESGGTLRFPVRLEGRRASEDSTWRLPIPQQLATVRYAVANGTAKAPGDYSATSGTMTFLAGETLKYIEVPIAQDAVVEAAETVTATLSAPTSAVLADAAATGTIVDDEPTITGGAVTLAEGDVGNTPAHFLLHLSAPAAHPVTVKYALSNGDARVPTVQRATTADYVDASGTAVFPVGTVALPVSISLRGDRVGELDELFIVSLSTPVGGRLGPSPAATVTIDDDEPVVRTEPSYPYQLTEPATGTTEHLPLPVVLEGQPDPTETSTVKYAVTAGTATAGSDFTALSGTLTFGPGEIVKFIQVPVHGDAIGEVDETVVLTISAPTNARLGATRMNGIIRTDETLVSAWEAVATEGAPGTSTTMDYLLTLSRAESTPVTVSYATANGTASSLSDYTSAKGTVTFAPGERSKVIHVVVKGDAAVEANETVVLKLSAPVGAGLFRPTANGTIENDD